MDQPPQTPSNAETIESLRQEFEARAAAAGEHRLDSAVDLLMATGTGLTRLCGVGLVAMPRLFVAAASRAVERLCNAADETQRAAGIQAAQDLCAALEDGLKATRALLTLLDDHEGGKPQ